MSIETGLKLLCAAAFAVFAFSALSGIASTGVDDYQLVVRSN